MGQAVNKIFYPWNAHSGVWNSFDVTVNVTRRPCWSTFKNTTWFDENTTYFL